MTTTDEAKPLKLRVPDEKAVSEPATKVLPTKKKRVRNADSLTALILSTNPIVNRDALRRTMWRLEREVRGYSIGSAVLTLVAFLLVTLQVVELSNTTAATPIPRDWLPFMGAAAVLLVLMQIPMACLVASRRVLVNVIREVLERDGLLSSPLPDVRHDPTTEL